MNAMRKTTSFLLLMTLLLLLGGCGGGGASPVSAAPDTAGVTPTGHSVTGKVTLGGAALAGVTVTLKDAATGNQSFGSTLTAADGSFSFRNLTAGSYTATLAKTGYAFDQAAVPLTVADSDLQVPELQSYALNSVSGKVTGANNAGLAGVTVSVSGAGSAVTDGNGRYSLSNVANGSHTVTAYRSYDPLAVSFDAAQTVTISDAAKFAVANFQGSVSGFTVSGKVTLLVGGQPLYPVALTLVTKNGTTGALLSDSAAIFRTVTDASGNYSLTGIPNGYYALAPVLAPYGFALIDAFATHGMTADNILVNGADLRLEFTARNDATGGATGF
jgi:hypothetical protein